MIIIIANTANVLELDRPPTKEIVISSIISHKESHEAVCKDRMPAQRVMDTISAVHRARRNYHWRGMSPLAYFSLSSLGISSMTLLCNKEVFLKLMLVTEDESPPLKGGSFVNLILFCYLFYPK